VKHAILGVGAVGGLIGAALASLGEDVTAIVRPESLPEYPRNLTLVCPQRSISAPVKVAAELTDATQVLWIATKTYQLQSALQSVGAAPACVVPLLNGVDHVEILRTRFGHDRVVPATIAVEAEKIAPGRFLQRSQIVRLNLAASGEPILGPIVARLGDHGFACQFIENEQTLLWTKVCFLAPFALVTSASSMNKGEILAHPEWRRKLDSSIAEAIAVANSSGAEIIPARLQSILDSLPAAMRSSMQKDLAAGRQLELDAIAGPIVRGGDRYGIDVSATAALVAAIRSATAPQQV
jgi:2-dehydropantoate 2-reductase